VSRILGRALGGPNEPQAADDVSDLRVLPHLQTAVWAHVSYGPETHLILCNRCQRLTVHKPKSAQLASQAPCLVFEGAVWKPREALPATPRTRCVFLVPIKDVTYLGLGPKVELLGTLGK